ncbi:MAG: glycosyltransferase [Lachnospiraceae bacterium]|nr:glycosyltransferase [Lachnospiraceae bacterium]
MLEELKTRIQKFLLDKAVSKYEAELTRQKEPYEQWIRLHEAGVVTKGKSEQQSVPIAGITVVKYSECGSDFDIQKRSLQDDEVVLFVEDRGTLASYALDRVKSMFDTNHAIPVLLYADEDYYEDAYGKRSRPWFKPEWSPDTLLSYFYIGSLFAVRYKDLKQYQWKGSADPLVNLYDFLLKLTDKVQKDQIIHLEEVLFHHYYRTDEFDFDSWIPGTGLEHHEIKKDALIRRGHDGDITEDDTVVYKITGDPMVSILIPSRNNPELLRKCLESIKNNTSYHNFEIIVIDNGSSGENRLHILELSKTYGFRHLYRMMEFNFSAMCNYGASHANGDYLLLLNDDCEVLQKDWMERLLGQAAQAHVGAAGAKLYYPGDRLIQHAGITNLGIGPAHKLIAMNDDIIYYHGVNRMVHDMIGVTAACLMVSKVKYFEAGGFCEEMKVSYNDVDFCFALHELGYYNCIRNDVVLLHHESLTRGNDGEDTEKWERLLAEKTFLYQRHPKLKGRDPYYSRHLVQNAREYRCNYIYDYEKTDFFTELKKVEIIPAMEENDSIVLSLESAGFEKKIDTDQQEGYLIEGWCFVRGNDNARYQKKFYLTGPIDLPVEEQNKIEAVLLSRYRKDVSETFRDEIHAELSGFVCRIPAKAVDGQISLRPGSYRMTIGMKDSCSRQFLCQRLEQMLTIL